MKKLAKIIFILLIPAVIITVVGGVLLSKENVNLNDIYAKLEETVPVIKNDIVYTKAPELDLEDFPEFTEKEYNTYQLIEFNSIAVYADKCTLVMESVTLDNMVVYLECADFIEEKATVQTAIKDGILYIKSVCGEDINYNASDVELHIGIPENYKGGYEINLSNSIADIDSLDSTMNCKLNLYNCDSSIKSIAAENVEYEISGGRIETEMIDISGGFTMTCVSSETKIENLNAAYSKIEAGSSNLSFSNIIGGFSAYVEMSKAYFDFKEVTGNITLSDKIGRVNLTVPKNSPVSLRHSEDYGKLDDGIKWTGGEKKNENSAYIIDINVKFGIVTLSET